jgi:hypothetical protein
MYSYRPRFAVTIFIAILMLLGSAFIKPGSAAARPLQIAQQQKLLAGDPQDAAYYGTGVATDGNTVIVGAPDFDLNPNDNTGAAYIYVSSGGVWSQQAKLTPSSFSGGFGYSVAISGDTAVIGATGSNRAFIFTRSGTIWTEQAILAAGSPGSESRFGVSVAISGNTVLIGDSWDNSITPNRNGAAYVFVGSGALWTQEAKLTATDFAQNDYFGQSVSLSGDTAVIGAIPTPTTITGCYPSPCRFLGHIR